jgi:hypothetical protein
MAAHIRDPFCFYMLHIVQAGGRATDVSDHTTSHVRDPSY